MINSIDYIANIGTFGRVTAGKSLPLAHLTLIYAENSRGKTTLAEILRSLSTSDPTPIIERAKIDATETPCVVLEVDSAPSKVVFSESSWNSDPFNEVTVFDDAFVDGNVCSGLDVQTTHRKNLHELILGAQGVALNTAIQEQIEKIAVHNAELRAAADAIAAAVPFPLHVDDVPAFCNIPPIADVDTQLHEKQQTLDVASRFSEMAAAARFTRLDIPEFDAEGVDTLLCTSLDSLSGEAAERVHRHTSTLGSRGEQWLSTGIHFLHPAEQEAYCPFCAQPLSGSELIAHYQEYFGQEYTKLKEQISQMHKDVSHEHGAQTQIAFERAVSSNQQQIHFWKEHVAIDENELSVVTGPVVSAWSAAREHILAHISNKKASPLEELALSDDARDSLAVYETHRSHLARASTAAEHVNNAIQERLDQAANADLEQIAVEIDQLRHAQCRHSDALTELCDSYVREVKAKAKTEAARDAAKDALDSYRERVFPAYETGLNHYLDKFGAGFRIKRLNSRVSGSGAISTYALEVNGQLVHVRRENVPSGEHAFGNTLSSGDRNTLAFALFLESINQSLTPGELVAVIDDPVSSQDEGRFATTVAEVCKLVGKVSQVVVLSHNKRFLCQIWEDIERDYRDASVAIEIVRHGKESTLAEWKVTDELVTLHDQRHRLLAEYLESGSGDPREVATALRPHLEAFLRVARPALFAPGNLLGPFIDICKQRSRSGEAVFAIDKVRELEEIVKFANQFHHDTNPAYATAQIHNGAVASFAKRVLAFTEPQ